MLSREQLLTCGDSRTEEATRNGEPPPSQEIPLSVGDLATPSGENSG